ncbi:MAG TPA: leucine-rich repeat domain-containing protein, partial [Kofleriaceae bacterium]|nr:leucine-rich repeat domain-containing protein [Kofleriaceae bacterium]
MKLVEAHVKDGATIKSTLTPRFRQMHEEDACQKLRALDRKDVPQLALALLARGTNGHGVAFEGDPDHVRSLLPKLFKKGGKELFLNEMPTGGFTYAELTTIPDVVFDEIPKLRKKHPFTEMTIWSAPLTDFPVRFGELAPFLRKLRIGWPDFTELPDAICRCTNLEELELHAYKLAELNPHITKLKKLKRLAVTHSKVMTQLPPEICELSWLEELDLGFMKTKLPKEIGNMKALTKLELQSARGIRKLPPELAQCTKLKVVNVRWSGVSPEAVKAILPKVKVES